MTREEYKKIEDALCDLKRLNANIHSFGDGYDKAIDDAIEVVKNCSIPDVSALFSSDKLEQAYKDGVRDALAKGYGNFDEENYS